jgi:hypothetical protein
VVVPFGSTRALVGAVHDSLRAVARSGAAAPEVEPVARQLAGIADKLARSGRALRDAVGLTLLSIDTAVPSGRLGRLHLAFWPALQREMRTNDSHRGRDSNNGDIRWSAEPLLTILSLLSA